MTNAERQKLFRERQALKLARYDVMIALVVKLEDALREIAALTADKIGAAAVAIRKIAEDALS